MRAPVTNLLKTAVRDFASLPPFHRYVDPERILVVATRGRSGLRGKRAACHFTRFPDTGSRFSRDGHWEFPAIYCGGREMLYVISFVLPRFLFLSDREQAEDVVHELLHIDSSFTGVPSKLRHGSRYDRMVQALAAQGLDQGLRVPPLANDGDTILYHRLRPFPHPFRCTDRAARRTYDDTDLELAALKVNPIDRLAKLPRYLYECPQCGEQYARQRPLRMASCGSCAGAYDGRFKLKLVRARAGR